MIQLLQYQKRAANLNELIANVEEAYTELPLDVCRHIWSTAQIVMNSILLSNGSNQYKLPHIGMMQIACALGEDFPMRLLCQALVAGVVINEATITAFVAAEEANGKFLLSFDVQPPLLNLRHLNKLIVMLLLQWLRPQLPASTGLMPKKS